MDLPAACGLHSPGGSWLQDAGDGVDALVACTRVLFAEGGAVNGIHSCRFDCYRIPAGCLVTVSPPWVHAARRCIESSDHAPGASDARHGCGMSSRCLFFFDKWLYHENSLIWFAGAGILVARRRGWWRKVTAMFRGANQWHACIQPIPQPLDLRLKQIFGRPRLLQEVSCRHGASCRKFGLPVESLHFPIENPCLPVERLRLPVERLCLPVER